MYLGGWTHVTEIPNTKLLVSLHHKSFKSANFELFDISKKGQANKIYSFEEVSGGKFHGPCLFFPKSLFSWSYCTYFYVHCSNSHLLL